MRFSIVLLVALLGLAGCGFHQDKVQPVTASAVVDEPLLPTFSSIRSKLLVPRCGACHPIGVKDPTDYAWLARAAVGEKRLLVPGDPESSFLYLIFRDNLREGVPKTTDAERDAIFTWIKNGSAND